MTEAQVSFAAQLETMARAPKRSPSPFILRHTLFFLPILVGASIILLLLTFLIPKLYRVAKKLFTPKPQPILLADEDDLDNIDEAAPPTPILLPSGGLASDFRNHVRSLRDAGSVLFGLEVVRLLCLGGLLGLSIYAAVLADSPIKSSLFAMGEGDVDAEKHKGKKHRGKKHKEHHDKSTVDDYSSLEWGEFGVTAFYAYSLILAIILLTLRPATPLRRQLIAHLDVLLFLAFLLYAYRDLWPLLTYYLKPSDVDTPITWARLGLLSAAAVLIPLIRPRTYVPVDPYNPTPKDQIHPEQTAPLISYVFYEFMTGMVLQAWKTSSLPYDQFHPMADYDCAQHLYNRHTPTLDPIKRQSAGLKSRHLVLLLASTFRYELIGTSLMCVFCAVFELSGSVGINQLLEYLEHDGVGAKYKPIIWIALLFLGPLIGSLSIQYYIFLMTRALVRAESLLTQLIFDHALRLRMIEATEDTTEAPTDAAKAATAPLITIDEPTEPVTGPAATTLTLTADAGNEPVETGQDSPEGTEVGSSEGSKKGKSKEKDEENDGKNSSKGQGLAGKINVLIAADVESIVEGRDLPLVFVYTPIQFALCVVFLYQILSWSSIVGMLTMLATMPLPGLATKWNAQYQQQRMEATDARIDVVTEAVGALRMLKMFGWEERMKSRIAVKREAELGFIWRRRLMNLVTNQMSQILPILTMVVTFAVYTGIQKKELTASTVFTSMTVFDLIKGQFGLCFYMINQFITSGVSVNRIDKFLRASEMIDEYSQGTLATIKSPEQLEAEEEGLIRIKNATFTWGTTKGTDTPTYRLRVPDVSFVKGKINLITGSTGSGKSTLLKALIGELHFHQAPDAFFHLPRSGGVSYAAQESWVMSETIKDNILFGEPFDAERYRRVLVDCGLETDLKLFDDGDATEIGEKGVTLSGGQKARITLARAVYGKTDVVLLDDVFSALDTLTSRWIIDHLFKGDLMAGRTVLLITHHVGLVAPIADYMVVIEDDGSIRSAGPVDAALANDEELEEQVKEDIKESKEAVPTDDKAEDKKVAAKLIKDEEKSEGRISKRAMISFFGLFGGPIFWVIFLFLILSAMAMESVQPWWLGQWARAYARADGKRKVSVPFYLGIYIGWVMLGLLLYVATAFMYFFGGIKASRTLHKKLVDTIFGAYMRFLDSTPVGRIISRFTKDIKQVDGGFTDGALSVAELTISLFIKFVVVVALVPIFSIPAIVIGGIGGFIGELYIHAQLSVKREMSNAKSPLFSHFASAVNGIVSIRAYGAHEKLRAEARRKADKYTRTARAFYNLNRWVTVRVDMLGGLFAASLAAFLIYGKRMDASTTGFALSQAISLSQMILWWVRQVNEMEVAGNSVERIEDYLVIDQEPALIENNRPPAAWPTSGEILLEKLSAKYSDDGPIVLDSLDVHIKSGEKVGIVGRTGSGKSTLALALLRMIPTSGIVTIDGVRTKDINLNDLRSHVTIIPQDPILLSGSMRFNLDPFGDHDDATLNVAFQSSGLGQIRHSESGASTPARLSLDFQIAAGGGNLSQGQRQLVALARALVRSSKVLILDEATASVDFETDTLIQKSIRALPSSTTVLTVAHRLATVMDYDKILVLGAGKVLEFDSPEKLKADKGSYFAKLVQAMEG